MKRLYTCVILLACAGAVWAQNIIKAEYFIDQDLGFGNNAGITFSTPVTDISSSFTAAVTGLAAGPHKLYIRTLNSAGVWSITSRRDIEILPALQGKTITGGEYFFDTDNGFGSGSPVTLVSPDSIVLQNITAVTSSLTPGYHKLYIRFRDSDNRWGQTTRNNVDIIKSINPVLNRAEYFFITDAGFSQANPVHFSLPSAGGSFSFFIPTGNIPTGAKSLYIRARDSANMNWSFTVIEKDSVITSTGLDSLWSRPATWSNNKVPDSNTVVILHHKVYVDITTAECKSLVPFRNAAQCIVWPGNKLAVRGTRTQ